MKKWGWNVKHFVWDIKIRAVPIAFGKIKRLKNYNALFACALMIRGACICTYGYFMSPIINDKMNAFKATIDERIKTHKQKQALSENSLDKIQELYSRYATIKENGLNRTRARFAQFFNTWTNQYIDMDTMQKSFEIYTDEEYYEMYRIRDECKAECEKLHEQEQMLIVLSKDLDNFMKELC